MSHSRLYRPALIWGVPVLILVLAVVNILPAWVVFIAIPWLLIATLEASTHREDARLRRAPSGTQRIETIKANQVDARVGTYREAGWTVAGQSSAKSIGRQAQVTITFTKP